MALGADVLHEPWKRIMLCLYLVAQMEPFFKKVSHVLRNPSNGALESPVRLNETRLDSAFATDANMSRA